MMEFSERHFEIAVESQDGIEKLRGLILNLAIRGKLVRQDPGDGRAADLLGVIEKRKKSASEERGSIYLSQLVPATSEEGPFGIPGTWAWVTLGAIGEINPRNQAHDEKEVGFVPMPLVYSEYGRSHGYEKRQWGEIKRGYTHFADGDIALAKITPCFENGKSCVFNRLPNGIGAGTTELHIFRNSFQAVEGKFLLSYLKSPWYISNGVRLMTGSAGQKRVPRSYFESNPFPLPPLGEQKRIVAKIDQLMSLCDKLEAERNERDKKRLSIHAAAMNRLLTAPDKPGFNKSWNFITKHFDELYSVNENVAELKKGILQLAVMGKLVPQDPRDKPASELLKETKADKEHLVKEGKIKPPKPLSPIKEEEIPYELPKGWVWTRFGDITVNRDGERIPVSKDERANMRGEYDYYGASGVIDKVNQFLFDKSLLLIGEDGANLINRSTPIAFMAHGKYWVNNHAHVIDALSIDLLLYLEKFINAIDLKPYITGTAQPKMNQAKMNSIVVALPPVAEQKSIVARIDRLTQYCSDLETGLTSASQQRASILDAVLARA